MELISKEEEEKISRERGRGRCLYIIDMIDVLPHQWVNAHIAICQNFQFDIFSNLALDLLWVSIEKEVVR